MPRPLRRLAVAAAMFLLTVGPYHAARAALTLHLADGSRVTVAEIAAANDATLVVAATAGRARAERSIPWSYIVAAMLDGQPYSAGELRASLGLRNAESATHHGLTNIPAALGPPPMFVASPPILLRYRLGPAACCSSIPPLPSYGRVIGVRPDPLAAYADLIPSVYPNGIPSTEAPFALALLRERRRLETIAPILAPAPWSAPGIMPGAPFPGAMPSPPAPNDVPLPTPGGLSQIEARVTPLRTGGGADVNALAVELVGFDLAGNAAPVEGTAQAFLYSGRQTLFRAFDNVYAARPEGLVRLAEWTRAAQPGQRLILPLPEPLPEHDPTLSDLGTLRIRLTIPGSGVFETIAEPVALRPASPLRDAVRAENGSRFLMDEQTTGRRSETSPNRRDFTSAD